MPPRLLPPRCLAGPEAGIGEVHVRHVAGKERADEIVGMFAEAEDHRFQSVPIAAQGMAAAKRLVLALEIKTLVTAVEPMRGKVLLLTRRESEAKFGKMENVPL